MTQDALIRLAKTMPDFNRAGGLHEAGPEALPAPVVLRRDTASHPRNRRAVRYGHAEDEARARGFLGEAFRRLRAWHVHLHRERDPEPFRNRAAGGRRTPQPVRGDAGAADSGPRNLKRDRRNPDMLAPPQSHSGTIPNLKFSSSDVRSRFAGSRAADGPEALTLSLRNLYRHASGAPPAVCDTPLEVGNHEGRWSVAVPVTERS